MKDNGNVQMTAHTDKESSFNRLKLMAYDGKIDLVPMPGLDLCIRMLSYDHFTGEQEPFCERVAVGPQQIEQHLNP